MATPKQIVQKMMQEDAFSQWLGIEVLEVKAGYCKLQMVVRPEMCNGFGILHGGVTFSLADSALAFAANGHGNLSLALDAHITFPKAARISDTLTAEAKELHLGTKTAHYHITVTNQEGLTCGIFNGNVYRTSQEVIR
ncbi:MAG: hotdog fold thioesterase [Bacteroidota bacterium]